VSDTVSIEDKYITAGDGYKLAATVYAPAAAARAIVLINSATAVPRKIYRGFATYLAERGLAALTYDYRGVGGSRPATLRGFSGRMRDWAALDVAAAVAHARQTWPSLPLLYVGHSFGGQALGLIPNNSEVSRAYFVSAQAAYWRQMPVPENFRAFLLMNLVGRTAAHAIGYVPGWIGIGEDLPKGVFLEWAGWVLMPRYFFDDSTLAALENFPRYRGALRAVGTADDPWATPAMIDMLASGYSGAAVERATFDPRGIGANAIGHFGFFRPQFRDALWRDAADWLMQL